MSTRVSIIIPTLNEEAALAQTLLCLTVLEPAAWEILIVDGGSADKTIALAQAAQKEFSSKGSLSKTTFQVIHSQQAGRSIQMNQGAEIATGDVLCFLHADTLVPPDLIAVIQHTLMNPTIACGGFISLMVGKHNTRWSISFHNYLKTYYAPLLFRPHLFFFKGLRLLFGDQVMFCQRSTFWECGGFDANLPIMEEADLCLKLVKYGRIYLINRVVQSSDRRVEKWGVLKANFIYSYIGFLWGVGVSAQYLKRFYEDIR